MYGNSPQADYDTTPEEDLGAFDILPAEVREILREAYIDWSAEWIMEQFMMWRGDLASFTSCLIANDTADALAEVNSVYGRDHPNAQRLPVWR